MNSVQLYRQADTMYLFKHMSLHFGVIHVESIVPPPLTASAKILFHCFLLKQLVSYYLLENTPERLVLQATCPSLSKARLEMCALSVRGVQQWANQLKGIYLHVCVYCIHVCVFTLM